MPRSFVSGLSCPRCGRERNHRSPANLCGCGSPLFVAYDLGGAGAAVRPADIGPRVPTMWRYRELLPVEGEPVTLGEGLTPLLAASRLGVPAGLPHLWVKDEGANPTGTFKARGASCGVTRAVELGIGAVALPTAGNAGGAWAAYGAAAGIRVRVAMPSDAPAAARAECAAYGAEVLEVPGTISDAARALASDPDWFDVATMREPYRVEGKKTLGFEIAEQLGWRAPDAIVYPAGGGVGLLGMWLAFEQLRSIGWISGPSPRLCAVQPAGCAPIVRAFERGAGDIEPWLDPETVAAGLRIPSPFAGALVLRAIRETGGTAITVTDAEALAAVGALARATGVLACAEAGAAVAGAFALRARGDLSERDRVVVVATGTAHKDPPALAAAAGRYAPV